MGGLLRTQYGRFLRRALKDTFGFLGWNEPTLRLVGVSLLVAAAGVVIQLAVLHYFTDAETVRIEMVGVVAVLISTMAVFAVMFVYNLIAAPARMLDEAEITIRRLSEFREATRELHNLTVRGRQLVAAFDGPGMSGDALDLAWSYCAAWRGELTRLLDKHELFHHLQWIDNPEPVPLPPGDPLMTQDFRQYERRNRQMQGWLESRIRRAEEVLSRIPAERR
jgi:hypothetical protein